MDMVVAQCLVCWTHSAAEPDINPHLSIISVKNKFLIGLVIIVYSSGWISTHGPNGLPFGWAESPKEQ